MIEAFMYGWFAWPGGSVLTNLIASFILAAPVVWRLIRWGRKIEQSHSELHAKLDRLHEHLGLEEPE